MQKRIKSLLVKSSLTLAILCTIGIAVLSLIKPSYFPKTDISFSDKIGHFIAYTTLSILWLIGLVKYKRFKAGYIVFAVILYGIIIEVLQYSLTNYRSLDVYDMLANSIGALIGLSVYLIFQQQIVNVMES